jgi:hypothetical protein
MKITVEPVPVSGAPHRAACVLCRRIIETGERSAVLGAGRAYPLRLCCACWPLDEDDEDDEDDHSLRFDVEGIDY